MRKQNSFVSNPLCIFNDLQFCEIIESIIVSIMMIQPWDEDTLNRH